MENVYLSLKSFKAVNPAQILNQNINKQVKK